MKASLLTLIIASLSGTKVWVFWTTGSSEDLSDKGKKLNLSEAVVNQLKNESWHEWSFKRRDTWGTFIGVCIWKKKILIAKLLFYLMLEKVDVVKDTKLEHLVQFSMNLVLDQYLAWNSLKDIFSSAIERRSHFYFLQNGLWSTCALKCKSNYPRTHQKVCEKVSE